MALQLVISETSISDDCDTLVVSDTTGNYNVTTNPGGYGAPNATRASLYLLVLVNLRLSSGRQAIDVPTYNKNTGSTWTITLAQDGWYEIYAFACQIYAGGTTYALGYITYDLATDAYYKSLQAGNTGHAVTASAWWEATVDVEDFAAAVALIQPNVYETTLNDVQLCRSVKCKALALFQAAQADDCCSGDNDCALQTYEKIRLRVEAALVAAALQDYLDAEEFIEDINTLCVRCGCACD